MTPNTWIDKAYQFMLLGRDGFWIGHDHVIMMLATVLSQNDWFPKHPSHLQLTISGCFPFTVDNFGLFCYLQVLFGEYTYSKRCNFGKFSTQIHACAVDNYHFCVVFGKIRPEQHTVVFGMAYMHFPNMYI